MRRWQFIIAPISLGLMIVACHPKATISPDEALLSPQPKPTATPVKLAEPQELHTIEGITEFRLENGLRVLLFPDQSKEQITVNITYFVGSRHEGYGETGMAHLLEHMLFKGTPDHPDLWKSLQSHGASFNGTTWVDRTNYYETLPASTKNLEFALRMEADRMINSTISPKALAKEFSVVRNELERGENSPFRVLLSRIYSSAYLWHNYGKSTIGSRSDLENVSSDRLRAFYERYYQPDNAMLVVAGKFKKNEALELVQKYYATIPAPKRQLEPTYTIEPVQDGERYVQLKRTGDVSIVGVGYHIVPGSHVDYPAAEALVHILTNEPSGRLYKELVKTGLAEKIYGFAFAWHDPGMLQLFAEVRNPKKLASVRQKMVKVLDSIASSGIETTELERYKSEASKDFELAMTNSQRIAIELSESAALGDWRLHFVNRDRTESLNREQIQQFASQYVLPANRTIGEFSPTEKPLRAPQPEQPDVVATVNGYQGREALSEGEAFIASIENIESRTSRNVHASGLKVALLPKKTRGEAVTITMKLNYGSLQSLSGQATATKFIGDMLMRGSKQHDFQQLKDELSRLKTDLSINSGVDTCHIRLKTKKKHLPEVLTLLNEILLQPKFSAKQFEILRKETLVNIEMIRKQPNSLAFVQLNRSISPYPKDHPFYQPTFDERIREIQAVRISQIKQAYRDLWGSQDGELVAVGDFDPAQLQSWIDQSLSPWRAKTPYQRIEKTLHPAVPGSTSIDTPDKEMGIVVAGQKIALQDTNPDYPALILANFMLGGSTDSRLFGRLRQKEGWSYSAFSFFESSAFERVSTIGAGAICAPQNAGKVERAMFEEIDRFVRDGVSEVEIAKAKSAYALKFANNLANDGFVGRQIAMDMHRDRTLAFQKQVNDRIATMSPKELNAAIKRWIRPQNFVKIQALDVAKSKTNANKGEPSQSKTAPSEPVSF